MLHPTSLVGVPVLGPYLREERIRRGLRLVDVAKHLGMSIGMVSEVERGRRHFSDDRLPALAALLEVPVDELRHRAQWGRSVKLWGYDSRRVAILEILERDWEVLEASTLDRLLAALQPPVSATRARTVGEYVEGVGLPCHFSLVGLARQLNLAAEDVEQQCIDLIEQGRAVRQLAALCDRCDSSTLILTEVSQDLQTGKLPPGVKAGEWPRCHVCGRTIDPSQAFVQFRFAARGRRIS